MAGNKIRQHQKKDPAGKLRIDIGRAYARQHHDPLADVLNLSFLFTVLLFALCALCNRKISISKDQAFLYRPMSSA
jgi:hypothetical protein